VIGEPRGRVGVEIIQLGPSRVEHEIADGEFREAVVHIEVEAVHKLLGAVEVSRAKNVDRTDDRPLVAGHLPGVVGREEITIGLGNRETDHGAVALIVGGAGAEVDGVDRLAGGERGLRGGLEGGGVVGNGAGRRDDALLLDLPVVDRDGETFHVGQVDHDTAGFALGGFGFEREVAGGHTTAVRWTVGREAGDRTAVGIGAAGDRADERAREELR